jgi:LacI family transcriptional regulator
MAQVTMKEVAARAGVSTATVSLVLSKSRFVSDVLTARVTLAVEELGYRRNSIARSLRRQSSDTIGVLIPTILSPFYPAVLKEIDNVLLDRGFSLLFANTREDQTGEASLITLMQEKQVDGLLISPYAHINIPLLQRMVRQGIPVITFHRGTAAGSLDTVTWDDEGGSYQATRHLLQTGRKRVAIMTSWALPTLLEEANPADPDIPPNLPRLKGYLAALREAGIEPDPALHLVGGTSERRIAASMGREAIIEAMKRPLAPDAVFVSNSSMALGVLQWAEEAGIRIPDDLAVVGYDEHPWTQRLAPPLSVVARDPALLGAEAARLLLRRLDEGRVGEPETIVLPTRLIVRASSQKFLV